MNNNVILTCAITGSGDTAKKHPNLPITPKQIADEAIGKCEGVEKCIVIKRTGNKVNWSNNRDIYLDSII